MKKLPQPKFKLNEIVIYKTKNTKIQHIQGTITGAYYYKNTWIYSIKQSIHNDIEYEQPEKDIIKIYRY